MSDRLNINFELKGPILYLKPPGKHQNVKTGQTSPCLGFTKKSSTLTRVVWDEESKTDLKFEIGPSYNDVLTTSQLVTDSQSSCITMYVARSS